MKQESKNTERPNPNTRLSAASASKQAHGTHYAAVSAIKDALHAARYPYGDVNKTGEGPDGRGNCYGYDCEHPDYSGEQYTCEECGAELTEEDN